MVVMRRARVGSCWHTHRSGLMSSTTATMLIVTRSGARPRHSSVTVTRCRDRASQRARFSPAFKTPRVALRFTHNLAHRQCRSVGVFGTDPSPTRSGPTTEKHKRVGPLDAKVVEESGQIRADHPSHDGRPSQSPPGWFLHALLPQPRLWDERRQGKPDNIAASFRRQRRAPPLRATRHASSPADTCRNFTVTWLCHGSSAGKLSGD